MDIPNLQKRKQVQSNDVLHQFLCFVMVKLHVEFWNITYGRCGNENTFCAFLSCLLSPSPFCVKGGCSFKQQNQQKKKEEKKVVGARMTEGTELVLLSPGWLPGRYLCKGYKHSNVVPLSDPGEIEKFCLLQKLSP